MAHRAPVCGRWRSLALKQTQDMKTHDSGYAGISIVEIDGLFYPVARDEASGRVRSIALSDHRRGGGQWCAHWSEAGVRYVAKGRKTLKGARSAIVRAFIESFA